MASTGHRIPRLNQKLRGFKDAVGDWNSAGTWRRINDDETPEKIRVLLGDKMVARGHRVGLWTSVTPSTPNVIPCTCERVSTDASQRRCDSCYGVKLIPGYTKFAHETIFFASAEYAGFTLTNTAISTLIKPFPILLSGTALSGTIVTPDKPYTNPESADWDIGINAFMRAPGATVTLEFSTNSGGSYTAVPLTPSTVLIGGLLTGSIPGVSMTGTGTIRFRITMTRVNPTDAPTAFEIVRVRRTMPEVLPLDLKRFRPDIKPGEILIEKTWIREIASLSSGRGRVFEHASDGSWACPLDFYSTAIARDTPAATIEVSDTGHHAFYEYTGGVQARTRYLMTEIDEEQQIGIFSWMGWVDQRIQQNDPNNLVF